MDKRLELEAIQLIQKSEMMGICKHGETLCELIATKKMFAKVMKKLLKLGDGNPKVEEQLAELSKIIAEADAEILEHEKAEQELKEELNEKEALFKMGGVLEDLMNRHVK